MQNESKKKILIIGAGVSGLTAGIYGQKNGFETEIFERLPMAGGLCVNWERKGMPIDGCIHWLTGTRKDTELHKSWMVVNAFKDEDIIHSDNFGVFEYKGKVFTLYTDLKKLKEQMLEISPQDKRMINKTIKFLGKVSNMPLPMDRPLYSNNVFSFIKVGLKLLPYLPSYLYCKSKHPSEYAKKFKSEYLRYFINNIIPGDGNLYAAFYAYGTPIHKNGGVPKGGSGQMTKNMEKEYLDNGGKIHYNSEIEEILTENKKIVGFRLKNGEIVTGDYYVSCIDPHQVMNMMKGVKRDKKFTVRFDNPDKYPTPSCVYISYKVNLEKLKTLNINSLYQFECEPYKCGTKTKSEIKMRDYSYDDTFIKDGNVLMTVLIHQTNPDYYYWEDLRKDYKVYLEEKNRIAEDIKQKIINRFPSLEGVIETIDVCTPMTYKRYVNAYNGAYMCWSYTHIGKHLIHNHKIGGFKNFVFAGQWYMMPGGLPPALLSGKFAIQLIRKKEHLPILEKEYL